MWFNMEVMKLKSKSYLQYVYPQSRSLSDNWYMNHIELRPYHAQFHLLWSHGWFFQRCTGPHYVCSHRLYILILNPQPGVASCSCNQLDRCVCCAPPGTSPHHEHHDLSFSFIQRENAKPQTYNNCSNTCSLVGGSSTQHQEPMLHQQGGTYYAVLVHDFLDINYLLQQKTRIRTIMPKLEDHGAREHDENYNNPPLVVLIIILVLVRSFSRRTYSSAPPTTVVVLGFFVPQRPTTAQTLSSTTLHGFQE